MPSASSWDVAVVALGLTSLWASWCCGLSLAKSILGLLQRAKYEKTVNPLIPIALQGVLLAFGTQCSLTLQNLGIGLATRAELHPAMVVLSFVLPVPFFAAGSYLLQQALVDSVSLEGIRTSISPKKQGYLLPSTCSLSVGVLLSVVLNFFGVSYTGYDRTLSARYAILLSAITFVLTHGSVVTFCLVPRYATQLAALVQTAACSLLYFGLAGDGGYTRTEYYPAESASAYWANFFAINAFLALNCCVHAGALVVASFLYHPGLHNSYAVGLLFGLTVASGLSVGVESAGKVVPSFLAVGLAMAYFTSLAGLGEWIPLGMTAGFGYATALQFESGGTALAAGIGLAVGLTMLLHASLVLTFEFYRIVADVKNNASAPPAKSGAS